MMLILRRVLIGLISLTAMGAIGLVIAARTASPPVPLGVTDGQLAPCPPTPNCVSSQQGTPDQQMPPIPYTTSPAEAQNRLMDIVSAMGRSRLVENEMGYLHFEFRSPTFGFVDDVEFLIDEEDQVIHFRAAARLGRSDMGVNRNRMEQIRQQFLESAPQQ